MKANAVLMEGIVSYRTFNVNGLGVCFIFVLLYNTNTVYNIMITLNLNSVFVGSLRKCLI